MQVNAGLFFLALAGFAALAAAQPHGNLEHRAAHDRHQMQRRTNVKTSVVTEYVTVTGYTSPSVVASPTRSSATPSSSASDVESPTRSKATPSSSASAVESPTSSSATPSSSASAAPSHSGGNDNSSGSGVGSDYPDGKYDCDHFPSDYGAISLPNVTKEGWSGIQVGNGNGDAVGKCVEGALCSYACPPGYSKSQWPADQPASGESHGGLLCQNGKLHLTRSAYPKLCQAGEGGVTVQNMLTGVVAICRTDYPGTEGMVIPLSCAAGSSNELTVPISDVSYMWQGKPTSAQYYVNPVGVSVLDGCTWGKEGGGKGNWSPLVFGAGAKDGFMWLSISQNQLNSSPPDYNVAIIGGNSVCKCEDGVFSNAGGCTTAVPYGQKARFVLYPKGSSAPDS